MKFKDRMMLIIQASSQLEVKVALKNFKEWGLRKMITKINNQALKCKRPQSKSLRKYVKTFYRSYLNNYLTLKPFNKSTH